MISIEFDENISTSEILHYAEQFDKLIDMVQVWNEQEGITMRETIIEVCKKIILKLREDDGVTSKPKVSK